VDTTAKDKMCRTKKPFPTFDAALKGTLASSKKFGPMGMPYHCPVCGKYHITSHTR
jgi:hypothetical protein